MKLVRCIVILLIMALAVGIGVMLCGNSKAAEKTEEAVMI